MRRHVWVLLPVVIILAGLPVSGDHVFPPPTLLPGPPLNVPRVVVAAGANDEPGFSHVLDQCAQAWFNSSDPGCGAAVGPDWQRRVDAMVPKLVRTLTDIQAAMREANYRPGDYELVLQSYAAPVGPDVAPGLQDLSGCPFRSADL